MRLFRRPDPFFGGARFLNLEDVPLRMLGRAEHELRVLLLADDKHGAAVVKNHINSFQKYSANKITIVNPIGSPAFTKEQFKLFDVVLIHYSIYILGEYYLSESWLSGLIDFSGIKTQIIQDEHRNINAMKGRMALLGVRAVFSSMEPENTARVYGGELLRRTYFFSCLPGYIADGFGQIDAAKIADRSLDVVYRGRRLSPLLGIQSQEKETIGDQILEVSARAGLTVDISSAEHDRIYGDEWMKFLASGRTTLGVEGGVSIFDFDGSVIGNLMHNFSNMSDRSVPAIFEATLGQYEGNVIHRTITPRIFEAIACKTALIMYPGRYREILDSGRHYIEMARDASNIEDVICAIKDTKYLQEMVNRTHMEILAQDRLSDSYYVKKIDAVIAGLRYCQ